MFCAGVVPPAQGEDYAFGPRPEPGRASSRGPSPTPALAAAASDARGSGGTACEGASAPLPWRAPTPAFDRQ